MLDGLVYLSLTSLILLQLVCVHGAIAGIAVGTITGHLLIAGFFLLGFFIVAGILTCFKGVYRLVLIVGFFFIVFFCGVLAAGTQTCFTKCVWI